MNGFLNSVLNLVLTTKANRKYRELQTNPEEAEKSEYFGKKFIACVVGALVLAGIAAAFSAVCLTLQKREADLASGFVLILYIVCFAAAVLFALYAVIFLLARLKYVKWQRSLNALPIGKKAKTLSVIALILVLALAAVAVLLAVLSLG